MIVTAWVKDGVCVQLVHSDELEPPPPGYVAVEVPAGVPLSPPSPGLALAHPAWQWVDPSTPETKWASVRTRRDALLAQSDWTQLPDVPLATKETWAIYRQALRDVTTQPDPFSIVWPVAPF